MDIEEVTNWVNGIKVAGEPLAYGEPTLESHWAKYVLYPTQDQLAELKIGDSLPMQEGDLKNELIDEEGKIVLVVDTDPPGKDYGPPEGTIHAPSAPVAAD